MLYKRGLEFTKIDEYLFDMVPYAEDIDMGEVRRIEAKVKDFNKGISNEGLEYNEAFTLLDWVTYNSRSAVTDNIPESVMSCTMQALCAPSQYMNTILLRKMGLDVKTFNMDNCIGSLPKTDEELNRIRHGHRSNNVSHSIAMVEMPIQTEEGLEYHKYLLDPTFRQFCLKENCKEEKYRDEKRIASGHVAPDPGYFLSEEYLKGIGKSEQEIEDSKYVADVLINRGYMELTDKHAKIYGDIFAKASIPEIFKDSYIFTKGREYISNFETNEMKINKPSQVNEKYFLTPLEEQYKTGNILSKIKNFFLNFWDYKGIKLLKASEVEEPKKKKPQIRSFNAYKISPEELRKRQNAEKLSQYTVKKDDDEYNR